MRPTLPKISRMLQSLRRRQHIVWGGAVWIASIAVSILVLWFGAVYEAAVWTNPEPRRQLLQGLLLISGLSLGCAFAVSLVLLFSRRRPSDQTLARMIQRRDPEVRDRILDALALADRGDPGASEQLRAMALERIDEEASDLDVRRYVETGLLKYVRNGVLVGLGVIAFSLLVFGNTLFSSAHRLAHPDRAFLKPGTVLLALDMPDSLRLVQGDSLQLAVRARHNAPRELVFRVRDRNGSERVFEAKPDSADSMRFLAGLTNLQRGFEVFAEGRKAISDTARVEVVPRPRIARLEVTVSPPSYTGTDPIELPEGVGDVSALPGSRVSLELEASRVLANARLAVKPSAGAVTRRELNLRGRVAEGGFTFAREGTWWVELESSDGITSGDPLVWRLGLLEDLSPRVEIVMPEDGATIPDELVVPLAAVAEDDYGISSMNLRFLVYNSFSMPDSLPEEAYSTIELQPTPVGPGQYAVRNLWGLSSLPLMQEDELWFFVEAFDNDVIRGPKRARSEVRRLVYATLEDLFADAEEQESSTGEDITEVRRKADEVREKMEETLTRLRSNPDDLSWEETQALEQALETQDELMEQLDNASRTLEQMQQQFAEHSMVSQELMEKYSELQELLSEISTPEMEQAMEELRKGMEEMDGEKIREALEEMTMDQEKFIENIERSMSILEQLKRERRMEELTRRAEEMVERQQAINERLAADEELSTEEMDRLSREQERMAEDLEKLQTDMKRMAEELRESHPDLAEQMERLSDEVTEQQLSEQMQQTAGEMQQGRRNRAKESGQKSEQSLQQMAQKMRKMQQQMVQQNKQEIAELMQELAQKVLVVSRRQEDLRDESLQLGVSSPRYRSLAARQDALRQSLAVLTEDAREITKVTFFVGAQLIDWINQAGRAMDNAIDRYTDRRASDVTGEQQRAMAALHQTLRNLANAQQQMSQSGSGTGYQEMMEQLSQMAQQQRQLNQQSQGMPMPMPGQQMGQSSAMQRMAAQQRALAEAMRQLEGEARSMEDMLGTLDGLGEQMEEVAKDLENQNVTDRTKRLQDRILQRLLDSQRSLQNQGLAKKRESRTGEELRRSSPGPLAQDYESELRERMRKALEGGYKRQWNDVIRDYFRGLQQEAQPAEQ
ncbi:DUF4175 family protein [bacterium]|nr:DUF4175 family protein [bacterium]